MVVSKVFGADWFHLPMGHGQNFPVICVSHQGWAIHWAADLQFPGLSGCVVHPLFPQEKVKGVGNTISINL
jgi:hypothetical protein